MDKKFDKVCYEISAGLRLHHTAGRFAGRSTTPYPHYESELSLVYFRQGAAETQVEGKRYCTNDGDIILLKPSELCFSRVEDDKYHERITIYFNQSLLNNFASGGVGFLEPFVKRRDGKGNKIPAEMVKALGIDTQLAELLELVERKGDEVEIVAVCKAVAILSKLREAICKGSAAAYSTSSENPTIKTIMEYISDNFRGELCLEDIAKKFNLDKYYLSHLFRQQVGTSLWNYVIFKRITYFNELVRQGESITRAAVLSGFQNYSNFFRIYKKHTGISPAEYKKSLK